MLRNILIIVLLIPCLMTANESDSKSLEVAAEKGKTLSINLTSGGSIYIKGWSEDKIKVKATSDHRALESDRIPLKKTKTGFEINTPFFYENYSDGDYEVTSDIDLDIMVPEQYDLEIETMGGDIRISNVEGEFSGKTMGGELELDGLKGEVNLTTMGGEITLTNSELDGKLKTMGGDIRFENVKGNVDASTMGGEIHYRNVTIGSGKEEVKISTMGGEIFVDKAVHGANVHTMGGDIYIRKAEKYVKATTMGGEIDIDELDGWVKASTMGGDVTVKMVGDPDEGERDVDLSSMGGEIELILPAGISAEFEIELIYTKNSRRNYRISSDFKLKIEESSDWIYNQGTPRKRILGTGSVNGGKNHIHIKTINGNIRIKKK